MSFNIYRDYDENKKAIATISDITTGKQRVSKELLQDLLNIYGENSKTDRGGLLVSRNANEIVLEDSEKVARFELSTTNGQDFYLEFLSLKSKRVMK